MPSRPVRVVTQGPSEPVRVVTQGIADPVRIVSGTPSDPVRVVTSGISTPIRVVAGSILDFSIAEIGTIDASTVVVTFSDNISASDYSAGVTIKVNGVATSITSATRQADHAIVHYAIPVLWHGSGDVVTWEYASAGGNIVAETGGAALDNVAAQTVTNNCTWEAVRAWNSDLLVGVLNHNDPISEWPDDLNRAGRSLTAIGNSRPTFLTSGGVPSDFGNIPSVQLDGVDDFMDGDASLDSLGSCTILMAIGFNAELITKMDNTGNGAGWAFYNAGTAWMFQESGGANWMQYFVDTTIIPSPYPDLSKVNLLIGEVNSISSISFRINGVDIVSIIDASNPPVSNYSSSDHLLLGKFGAGAGVGQPQQYCGIFICVPKIPVVDRNALEARLAARYEITL